MDWWAWVERPCPGGWVSRRVSGRILSLFEGLELVGQNNQTKPLKTAEHSQGRANEGNVRHLRAFRAKDITTSIIERTRPSPKHQHTNQTYTLNWEEPCIHYP